MEDVNSSINMEEQKFMLTAGDSYHIAKKCTARFHILSIHILKF